MFEVEYDGDGGRVVHVVSERSGPPLCPDCGLPAGRAKQWVTARATHVPVGLGPVTLVVHKRRWHCATPWCERASFTEQVPPIAAGARISEPLREQMAVEIGDQTRPVSEVAAAHRVSWHTAHDAFAAAVDPVLERPLQPVKALGIDETRHGKPRYRLDEQGRRVLEADTWHTGLVDLGGGQGLLGQVEGRTAETVASWLDAQPAAWRDQISVVAIDMSTSYAKAVRAALPHAALAVDHFHVIQAANKVINLVRRRAIHARYGRRGRAGDPEYGMRRTLLRNWEDVPEARVTAMWEVFLGAGAPGEQVLACWVAKEQLRAVFRATCASQVRDRLATFMFWCADHAHIPELTGLAQTISTWRHEIATAILRGVSNAASEGTNRVIKLVARIAFGFRNPINQRRRARYATTRASRRPPSRSAARTRSPKVIT
ncbi:ISL3 family transposase [Nonomuraea sp. NPDC049400]|uniref:ISL3 family transposase n=1 Tax=Nonomuraea sp. NPDC049400 TaxID=3364352 RepID=UPI00379B6CA7